MKKILGLFLLCLVMASAFTSTAQKETKKITLEDLWKKGTFRQSSVYGLRSTKDGNNYTTIEKRGKQIVKWSYKTGKAVKTLLDVTKLEKHNDIRIADYTFSSDETKLLITTKKQAIYRHSFTAEYYVYNVKSKEIKLLSKNGRQQLATFSPSGKKIAFVRKGNIFIHDTRFGTEQRITDDGEFNKIINGAPDWVYEEEFAFSRAFEWSNDERYVAYLKTDESRVKVFHMNMFKGMAPEHKSNEVYPSNYSYKYPVAGEDNAIVSVHVYDTKDKVTVKMNIGKETDQYIPRIKWTQRKNTLSIIRMNRNQNKLEILLANARTGDSNILYREENKYYIAESNLDNLIFLEGDKNFIFSSEKSGYMHLYLYDMNGKEIKAVTKGNYDVIDFYGFNPKTKMFYYSSHEVSPMEKYIYSIRMDGKKKKQLTKTKGWNSAVFSSNYKYYINYVSNTEMPNQVSLYNYKGKKLRVLENNKDLVAKLKNYNIAKKEFIQIPAADGKTQLNAWIIKPTNFDATKTYPLVMTQYSGPNSQQVKNTWGIDWYNYLAQEGYIVVCVDPRGTGARGEEFRKCTYMQLGNIESQDQIAAAKYLRDKSYIDGQRICIWGWSYGGFMSSLCLMRGADVFSAAIAVAPVTHYKFYDSVYTERYMRRPQDNEKGYEGFAPLNWVNKMKGKFLLVHGTADDNVHVQNSYELSEALVQAGKQFEMQIYTNRNHGIYGGNTRLHLYNRFMKFLKENLK
ncbi:MAG: S9 family peptidase [Marinifilaceae bacterium]